MVLFFSFTSKSVKHRKQTSWEVEPGGVWYLTLPPGLPCTAGPEYYAKEALIDHCTVAIVQSIKAASFCLRTELKEHLPSIWETLSLISEGNTDIDTDIDR